MSAGQWDARLPVWHPAWKLLWRQPKEWVVWDGRRWLSPPPGFGYGPDTWVGIAQRADSPPWSLVVVDWDNPQGRWPAEPIRAAQAGFLRACAQRGWPVLIWRSKSSDRWPSAASAHAFVALGGRATPAAVTAALAEALGFWPRPGDARLAARGLDADGRYRFPAEAARLPVYLSVCPFGELPRFLDRWQQTVAGACG